MPKQFVPATWNSEAHMWEKESTDLYGQREPFLETFPTSGMMRNGKLSPLETSVPHTSGNEFSFLPTPLGRDHKGEASVNRTGGLDLLSAVKLLPTPRTTDSQGGISHGDGGPDLRTLAAEEYGNLLPTPCLSDTKSPQPVPVRLAGGHAINLSDAAVTPEQWGKYADTIARWEGITRPAPVPVELNKNGNPRLNAKFSAWMMGWPEGWVTDLIGAKTDPEAGTITRTGAMRLIGNGVCPQQAAQALTELLNGV